MYEQYLTSPEAAVLAESKGFDWTCEKYLRIPSQSHFSYGHPYQFQLVDWLRKVHKRYVYAYPLMPEEGKSGNRWLWVIWHLDKPSSEEGSEGCYCISSREKDLIYKSQFFAVEAGILEALKQLPVCRASGVTKPK